MRWVPSITEKFLCFAMIWKGRTLNLFWASMLFEQVRKSLRVNLADEVVRQWFFQIKQKVV